MMSPRIHSHAERVVERLRRAIHEFDFARLERQLREQQYKQSVEALIETASKTEGGGQ